MWESQAAMFEQQLSILNFTDSLVAYDIVQEIHKNQFRQSGEPYVSHLIKVAQWILNHNIHDQEIITAALLHDAEEDQKFGIPAIKSRFGLRVGTMVELVTKTPGYNNKIYLNDIAHMRMGVALDAGAAIVKASDRIHNISTLLAKSQPKIQKYVIETYCDYLPFLKECRKIHGRYRHIFVEAKNVIEPIVEILAKYEGIDLSKYDMEQQHG